MKGSIKKMLREWMYRFRRLSIFVQYYYDYKFFPHEIPYVFSVHRKGFSLLDWNVLGLENKDYKSYLSTRDYYKMHPLNGRFSEMIDDKKIIKEQMQNTPLARYMPDYYFQFDSDGKIIKLADAAPESGTEISDIKEFLKEKGRLAFKKTSEIFGRGFRKLEYRDGEFFINREPVSEDKLEAFFHDCRDYLVTEYLVTHPDLQEFWPHTANTMRYLVGRVGNEWRLLKCFIRFGNSKTGEMENFNAGGILCYINEGGTFNGGYVLKKVNGRSHIEECDTHPDTGKKMVGKIPCWDQVMKAAEDLEKFYSKGRYLGFDFVVTDQDKVKLLEINSLNSLDSLQLDKSILETKNGKWFYGYMMKKR